MKIVIKVELTIPQGLTVEDVKARWINNKVTASIAATIESCAVGQVVKIDTMEVQ